MQRNKRFNPLLQFQEEPKEGKDDKPKKIPRQLIRIPNPNLILSREEGSRAMTIKLQRDKIIVEPMTPNKEKVVNRIIKFYNIHQWKPNRKFKLDLQHTQINDEIVKRILLQISTKLTNLQQLSLDLYACGQITNYSVETLGLTITRSLTCLQILDLNVGSCLDITDPGVKALVYQVSRNLKDLQQLTLKFSGSDKITDDGVITFAREIPRYLPKLHRLSIYFDDCDLLTPKSFQILTKTISEYLVNLRHLALSFSWCHKFNTENPDLQYGFTVGKPFNNLQQFAINFSYAQATNKSLLALGKEIAISMPSLQQLAIYMDKCLDLTNEGAEALALEISKRLSQLNRVILSFYGTDVTEDCKERLREMLSSIPQVRIM